MDIDINVERSTPETRLESPGLDYQFNICLFNIAKEMTDDDLVTLKYFIQGDQGTPRGVLEKITTPLQLFNHLRGRCLLSRDNILFLQSILYHAGRIDLYNKLLNFAKQRGNILHCYPESDAPVNGYKYVKFHIGGTDKLERAKIEAIRAVASVYLDVPPHFVTVQGIQLTESFLLTFMIPDNCFGSLLTLVSAEKQTFLSLGVDVIIVDETIVFCEESVSKQASDFGLQLNGELQHYIQRNMALQQQLEHYQIKELHTNPENESTRIMSSLTFLAVLMFNILQREKGYPLGTRTSNANKYFRRTLEKVKSMGYDKEVIQALLEANSLVVKENYLEEHRLLILQQKCHIDTLEHVARKALYKQDKLKYLLGLGVHEPILSQNEQFFLHYLTSSIPTRFIIGFQPKLYVDFTCTSKDWNSFNNSCKCSNFETLRVSQLSHTLLACSSKGFIDPLQLKPYFKEATSFLNEKDKQKLRQSFGLRADEERILLKQNFCFIEMLAAVEAKRNGGTINLGAFGEKLVSIVNRSDFTKQWHAQMEKHDLKYTHQKQRTETAKPADSKSRRQSFPKTARQNEELVSKIEDMSDKFDLMMRQMANIENVLQNPFARLGIANVNDEDIDLSEK